MEWWGWLLIGMAIMFVIYTLAVLVMANRAMRKMGVDPKMAIQTVKMMRGRHRIED